MNLPRRPVWMPHDSYLPAVIWSDSVFLIAYICEDTRQQYLFFLPSVRRHIKALFDFNLNLLHRLRVKLNSPT